MYVSEVKMIKKGSKPEKMNRQISKICAILFLFTYKLKLKSKISINSKII